MSKAAFKKDDLRSLVDDGACEGLEVVSDRIIGTGRWSVNYELVFKNKATGKFYMTGYSRGATEQQNEAPFEYADDLVTCEEVRPVQKTVTVYERA